MLYIYAIMCGQFNACFEFREIKIRYQLQGDLPLFARRRDGVGKVPVWFHLKKKDRSRLPVFGMCGAT